ncbi:MAG TPA: hypothetical protein VG994_10075 [Steroidobacteraceae bacterium]|nr:hypothetical protein [Steroidobacteraceae bacterium]
MNPYPPLLIVVSALLLYACSTPHTQFPLQKYVPVTRSLEPLGELHLSNTTMQLAALDGEMKLRYVGQMPDAAGEDLAGASVYRVRNWKPFFKQNAGRQGYCSEPPRYVAVNSETGAPAWSREITIAWLTLEEWSKFTPDEHHACASGKYVRTREE